MEDDRGVTRVDVWAVDTARWSTRVGSVRAVLKRSVLAQEFVSRLFHGHLMTVGIYKEYQ